MQEDLECQDRKLTELLTEVEEKKQLAEKYQNLAQTKRETFEAFRLEMEDTLRNELIRQAEKGKEFVKWRPSLYGS